MPVMNTKPGVLNVPKLGKISLFHPSLAAATSSRERTAQAKTAALAARCSRVLFCGLTIQSFKCSGRDRIELEAGASPGKEYMCGAEDNCAAQWPLTLTLSRYRERE